MANDKEVLELNETTTLADSDILPVQVNPAGTPATKKITKVNLKATLGVTQNTANIATNASNLSAHTGNVSNPHAVTKTQVGLSAVDNVEQMPLTYLDTDTALAANSNVKVPSQAAAKAYVDSHIGLVGANGWTADSDTYVYVSPTSFKVVGKDVTARFTKGARINVQSNGAQYYGAVVSSAFSTDTTVTVMGGSDFVLQAGAITLPYYSYQLSPQGYPTTFNYSCSWTNTSTNPVIGNGTFTAKFWITGNICTVNVHIIGGSSTTWGSGTEYFWSLPVNPITSTLGDFIGPAILTQNSTGLEVATCIVNGASTMGIASAIGSFQSLRINTTNPVTWTTNDKFNMTLTYIF